MNKADAEIITQAIVQIQGVLNKYPESKDLLDDRYIGVDVSTTKDEQNFFITRLEDLMEIGEPVGVEWYPSQEMPDDNYPYEVYTFVNGIEIHCICNQEDLDRMALNLPETE